MKPDMSLRGQVVVEAIPKDEEACRARNSQSHTLCGDQQGLAVWLNAVIMQSDHVYVCRALPTFLLQSNEL